jgi:uncharacterized protein YjdB/beta-N-acetylglucosaminidase
MMRLKWKGVGQRAFAMFMTVVMSVGVCGVIPKRVITVQAADAFETSISGFPESYKVKLRTLHKSYPNWKFVPYNTGINFNTAVTEESKNNKSLIENAFSIYLKSNASGDYNTSTGKYIAKDGGSWVSASTNCVAYFMDPRNFLDKEHMWMFEQLSYDAASQTKEGVEAILQGSFMYNTCIGYINSKGKYVSTDTLYSTQIMAAAKESKVSAYYIASKILQEIGTSKGKYKGMGASGSISGTYSSKYTGIYNFYNIGAYSSTNPIANGLSWASNKTDKTYQRPWTTPAKSINGGAMYIGEKYINCGQNTAYYQRFNVNKNSTYSLYEHQYMTNVYGAASEAALTWDAYDELGIAAKAKTFIIPVYSNMPDLSNKIVLGDSSKTGKTNSDVNMRKGPSTSYAKVVTLDKGDNVKILEGVKMSGIYTYSWLSNPYWYKVSVTKGGKTYTGYLSALYVALNKESCVVKNQKTQLPITMKTNETVYYMSDNPKIAVVDSLGNVTGKANGTTTIRAFAASGSMSAMAIEVIDKGVVLNKANVTLDTGKKKKLKATVYPTNATDKTVTFTSSNKSIAKVSKKGKITAKKPGTVTITATAAVGGAPAKCKVKVEQAVTGLKLNKTKSTIAVGSTETLKATIAPSNASNKTVTWKSSNAAVAMVSANGVVTAKTSGTAVITATAKNGIAATCAITVNPAVVNVKAKSKGYNCVKLKWSKRTDVTEYEIYKKNSAGKYVLYKSIAGTKTYFKDKKLITGTLCSYKVRAYKKVGNKKILRTNVSDCKCNAFTIKSVNCKPVK